MKDMVVEVKGRAVLGKNASRRLRRQGLIPAVVYGAGDAPVSVVLEPKSLLQILHSESGANTIFQLSLEGDDQRRHVMIKDYQTDPVKDRLMHADLLRIQMDEVIEVDVPVHVVGEAVGVKLDGGILDHVTREIRVASLPGNIPEHISIDVSALKIGDGLRVSDLAADDRYRILTEPDQTLVVISAPAKEEEAAPAAEAVVAGPVEPEVIKKGKAVAEEEGGGAEGAEDRKEDKKKDAKKPEAKK
jgi:large subunit ribosomal protein L25